MPQADNGKLLQPGLVLSGALFSEPMIGGDHSFDGDPQLLHLGLQAYALGIAWEIDPYFGRSISRVEQEQAVYHGDRR